MTAPNIQQQSNSSFNPQRGIASLTWGSHVLRFRTDPNEVTWNYSLITKTDQTYGGRVVQILGTRIDDLTVKVDCGQGGWPYLIKVVAFMRDLMVAQRNGQTAVFEYTTRNWKLKVYAASFPFADQVNSTTRELTLNFKVQEDISGIVSSTTISTALQSFINGIGWERNEYNDFFYAPNNDEGLIGNSETFKGGSLPIVGNIGSKISGIPASAAASLNIPTIASPPSVTGGALGSGIVNAFGTVSPQFNLFTIPTMQ